MALTRDDVLRVAHLAALELAPAEVDAMHEQLSAILAHMSELDALDVSGIEPTAHTLASQAPLRQDEVVVCAPREDYLVAAPASEDGGFAVPKVLDGT